MLVPENRKTGEVKAGIYSLLEDSIKAKKDFDPPSSITRSPIAIFHF